MQLPSLTLASISKLNDNESTENNSLETEKLLKELQRLSARHDGHGGWPMHASVRVHGQGAASRPWRRDLSGQIGAVAVGAGWFRLLSAGVVRRAL